MNHIQHHLLVKEAVKSKFHGHPTVTAKVTPKYPDAAEREFKRVTNSYMKLLNQTLKEHMPELVEIYRSEQRSDARMDGWRDIEEKIRRLFRKVAEELEQKIAHFRLDRLIERVSKMTRNTSLREWKRAIKETLGIDILSDYYNGDFYESELRRWTDENVLKIKSLPNDTLGEMQQIVLNGYKNGDSITTVTKAIQEEYGLSKRKAKLLARDQVSSLNAQITKMQQQDAGCNKYRWSDSRDGRVRDCHRSLNGKVLSWDDPPEMWYDTKKSGRVYTGRRCHPGEDFCCRCVAIPVFDIDTIDVPMKGS